MQAETSVSQSFVFRGGAKGIYIRINSSLVHAFCVFRLSDLIQDIVCWHSFQNSSVELKIKLTGAVSQSKMTRPARTKKTNAKRQTQRSSKQEPDILPAAALLRYAIERFFSSHFCSIFLIFAFSRAVSARIASVRCLCAEETERKTT